jgi:hypothetical protein
MSYDIGKFRPGGHSFTLANTKDAGDYLFTLRKNLGTDYWNDKTYHILWGFREIPTSATIETSVPLISSIGYGRRPTDSFDSPITFGYGVHPGGHESLATVREEVVGLYSGDIFSKKEDRINDRVQVSSKDVLKRINDFKVCTIIDASTVFTQTGYTELRGFVQVIKYGTHKLISNLATNTSENSPLQDRNNPFSATMGFPNLSSGDVSGGSDSYAAYHVWYFPFQNEINSSETNWKTGGGYKAYYWDYMDRIWRSFTVGEFDDDDIDIEIVSGVNGIYLTIADPANVDVGPSGSTDTWTAYLAPAGGNNHFTDADKLDVAICIETIDNLTDQNPVRIIYDLLNNSRFIGLPASMIDQDDFSSPNANYSFDQTFSFFDGESALINTSFTKEISLLKIIENISKLCTLYFFSSASKVINEDGEITQDRRIRLLYNRTVSPCADENEIPFLIKFSTAGKIQDMTMEGSSLGLKDKIVVTNFDSSTSTKDNFDIKVEGTGDRTLQLSPPANPSAYFYNSGTAAEAIAQRLLSQIGNAIEMYNLKLDASGLPVELGDYIEIHDWKNNETLIAQIFNWTFQLATGATSLVARRYNELYGPDPTNVFKKWAFYDCAYYDNDQTGGSGADASCPSSTTVTLGGGETIDSNLAFVGMDVTLDGNSQANSVHRRLKSITSSTVFEVDTAFTNNHTNIIWSIGTSYHYY